MTDHIYRIGIDRWFLKNIILKYPPHIKEMKFTNDGSLKEGVEIYREGFQLSSFTRLTKHGELLPTVTILSFNPNKILDGHNLLNSREGRTIEALEKIRKELLENEIELNYGEAIVESAEININFKRVFLEIEQPLDLMFSVLSNFKSKKIYGNSKEKHILNHRPEESHWWQDKGSEHRGYDKGKEIKEKYDLDILSPVTRLELEPSSYKFRTAFESKGLNTKLMTVLTNLEVIDELFKKFWFEVLRDTFLYLEKDYSRNIEVAYLSFKDIQKNARKLGRKVPRGIYKWLKENYIIYDNKYLIDIVKKYDNKNFKRERLLIDKIFNGNCLKELEYLSNFFSSLNSLNEEDKKEI